MSQHKVGKIFSMYRWKQRKEIMRDLKKIIDNIQLQISINAMPVRNIHCKDCLWAPFYLPWLYSMKKQNKENLSLRLRDLARPLTLTATDSPWAKKITLENVFSCFSLFFLLLLLKGFSWSNFLWIECKDHFFLTYTESNSFETAILSWQDEFVIVWPYIRIQARKNL